jgi:hypothetical protein
MATPFPFGSGNTLTAAQLNAITTLPINDQTASYVAVVGDVGKRIVMNVASGNTVTINNTIFAVGDTIFIANKGAGATTVTAGAGVTINTEGSLVLAQHGGGTLVALSASVFTFFKGGGANYGTATGGSSSSVTVSGVNYTLLTFTTSSTLTVTKAGLFDVLIFGGGAGGGGSSGAFSAGGGGAGGKFQTTVYLSADQTVTIGANGVGGTGAVDGNGTKGSNSIFGVVANALGGGAGNRTTQSRTTNADGGCGGGGADGGTGEAYVVGFGFNGGAPNANSAGGGGGGVAAVGGAGASTTGGAGGAGYDVSAFISGSTLYKCAGGAGDGGVGGSSVGGNSGTAAAANTASGGGGGQGVAGNGGSGIVYIRYRTA